MVVPLDPVHLRGRIQQRDASAVLSAGGSQFKLRQPGVRQKRCTIECHWSGKRSDWSEELRQVRG
eukprot:6212496-Pleurochrysis_carterae.AAC.2